MTDEYSRRALRSYPVERILANEALEQLDRDRFG